VTASPHPASPIPHPVIIDTDPGIDDCLALLLSLASPELDVRGISVSYGNTVVEHAWRNAVEILRRAGKRLPLAVGARRPLKRPLAVANETHGDSGLGYAAVPRAGSVIDYAKTLDRLLAEQPAPVTLVTLGPLTGLALALRREPALVRAKVARHLAMAGTFRAKGNTTKHSEFNAWCDPEALDAVLRAGLATELVPLDVTRQVVLTGEEVARLGSSSDDAERWLADALRFYVEFHRRHERLDGCVVNDVLPIAALVRPDVMAVRPSRVAVDLTDGDDRGRTRGDPEGVPIGVAEQVRPDVVRQLLFERVLRALAPAGTSA
jgi:inosine-uridine nucleoside N-ribohydrolase